MAKKSSAKTQVIAAENMPAQVSENRCKFTLYNLAGQEKAFYLVDRHPLQYPPEDQLKKGVAHNIIIVDRSGSMYYDIKALKEMLIKLLTLDEYQNFELLVSVISYSSVGDVICHFERVPVVEVMKPESRYLAEVKKIESTGATCISQGLKLAASLVKEEEVTGITLHTDGYANDPSFNVEVKTLEELCRQLQGKDVFLNTISYGYADFQLLSKLANLVSGVCLKAGNVKEVYDALYSTSSLLGGSVKPAIEEPLIKEYDYQVFVSKSAKKILGSSSTLKICGLKPEDEGVFYKYRKISKDEYEKLDVPVVQTSEVLFAFAKANLADGNLNTAKYALASTFDATLTEKHSKALTNTQIADWTQDLEAVIFNPDLLKSHEVLSGVKVNDKVTILELVKVLEENAEGIILNLKHLQQNYRRRGVKRIEGVRDKEGNLTTPWLKMEYIDGGEYVRMGSFSINQNTATINMLVTRKVRLVKVEDETPITEVAGVLVNDLSSFNNYTIVSDGELNVKTLKVKFSQKKAFEALKKLGVLDGEEFDFRREYEVILDNLPLVSFTGRYSVPVGVFEELAKIKVLSSVFAAHLKEQSEDFSGEQIEELKQHYLSKSLYISFPTTTEYKDLKEAINEGSIDSRVSYKIDVGSKEILNLGKLYSANKFLDRLYEVSDQETGEKIEKPSFDMAMDKRLNFAHKKLSSRTKITKVDDLMKAIFDDFLGLENSGVVADILSKVGADNTVRVLEAKRKGEEVSRDEFVAALTEGNKKLEGYADVVYREQVSPLVFYVGSTGLIPDELEAKGLTADELSAKYPDLNLSKDEREGMFFEVGDYILSVYAKNEYYSTR